VGGDYRLYPGCGTTRTVMCVTGIGPLALPARRARSHSDFLNGW
jgi:hypothetical protein